MSLRTKLFLIFGGLIAVLVIGQWWMVRGLTRNILAEVELLAVSVGRDMLAVFESDEIDIEQFLEKKGQSPDDEAFPLRKVIRRELLHRVPEAERFDDIVIKEIRLAAEKVGPATGRTVAEHRFRHNKRPAASEVVRAEQIKEQQGREKAKERELHHIELALDPTSDAKFLVVKTLGYSTKIPIPKHGLTQELSRLSRYLLLGSVLILALGLTMAGFLAHRVAQPLAALARAAEAVGGGDFGVNVSAPASHPEIRKAIEAFNLMSRRLVQLDELEHQHRQRRHLSELGEVARGLAHTLRNPLQTLGLSLEQMAGLAADREESRLLVDRAQRQIRRIDRWIRTFLALASEGRGEAEPLDTGALACDVVLEALQDNPGKVKIEVSAEEDLPVICAVPAELRAVVQALVVNAIEASAAGGTVTVRAMGSERGGIQLEVLDHGPGIAPAVRKRLFTPHVTTKPMGSGMGLFLAHRLATSRYCGDLQLLDVEPHGTRAVFWLPERNDYNDAHSHSAG